MDTHLIVGAYLRRPSKIAHQSLGEWFCNALDLNDNALRCIGSTHSAKDHILDKGYNNIGNLVPQLDKYNLAIGD